jgi:hypothetical protein
MCLIRVCTIPTFYRSSYLNQRHWQLVSQKMKVRFYEKCILSKLNCFIESKWKKVFRKITLIEERFGSLYFWLFLFHFRSQHGQDEGPDKGLLPDVVVFPQSTEEVSEVKFKSDFDNKSFSWFFFLWTVNKLSLKLKFVRYQFRELFCSIKFSNSNFKIA